MSLKLSLKARKEVSKELAKRYQKASRKEKKKILDEFVKLSGYNRCYASYLLRNWGRKVVINSIGGKRNENNIDSYMRQRVGSTGWLGDGSEFLDQYLEAFKKIADNLNELR